MQRRFRGRGAGVFVVSVFLFGSAPARGDSDSGTQTETPEAASAGADVSHVLYLEVGGATLLGSLNYELQPAPNLSLRAGIGFIPVCPIQISFGDSSQSSSSDRSSGGCTAVAVTTLGGSYSLFPGNHHMELGGLYTWAWMDDDDARFLVPVIGYRYQQEHGGFLFRAAFTPLVRANDRSDFLPWGGVSFGYSFQRRGAL